MSSPELAEHDLFGLIQGTCNATLTPAEFSRLVSMLRANVEARKLYLAYRLLDSELHWHQNGRAGASP
jgi:hypothetical protein